MDQPNLAEICDYLKKLIIPHTPGDFVVAGPFRHGLTDDELKAGIDAFRKFLYKLYDKLAENKDKIDVKTGAKDGSVRARFPIITDLAAILFSMGIHGKLKTKPGKEMTVSGQDLLTPFPKTAGQTEKYFSLAKLGARRKMEIFNFLSDLGLYFEGADFSQEVDFAKTGSFYIRHDDDNFVIGLKLLAQAQANVKDKYYKLSDVFMLGDFRPLANLQPKPRVVTLKGLVGGQAPEVKKWVLDIDEFLTEAGCKQTTDGTSFTYTLKGGKKQICKIYLDITGASIRPNTSHFANGKQDYKFTGDMLKHMRGRRACGICAEKDPNFVHCSHGGPYRLTHDDELFESCRYDGFTFPLGGAKEREILRKWVEAELAHI